MDQALDQPEAELEAWLQGLALPAPQAQALRSLLAKCADGAADSFLQDLPMLRLPDGRARAGLAAPGTQVGPWRLLRQLGQGGMSVVWLAVRADGQEAREVALKVPHAGPGQDLLAQRLMRERRILAALEHPHIARLYDVGISAAGFPYLVMELVQGKNLVAHADAQGLTLHQRVALFQQVLAAVQHAHGLLVLHRDIKPGNILVGPGGVVKLLDFGIAKLLTGDGTGDSTGDGISDGAGPGHTELTRAGDRHFTPSHASPEQLRGQPLGTASDVYALGVVLCELLSGQRPFAGLANTPAQLEAAVLEGAPPPPSWAKLTAEAAQARGLPSMTALAKALRGDLDAIVLKALAPEPADRYLSAEAFSADLARCLCGEPVRARGPGWAYGAGKFLRRHWLASGLGSLVAVALLVAAAVALLQARAAQQENDQLNGARDRLLQIFSEASPKRQLGFALSGAQQRERGRLQAQDQLAGQPKQQAELLADIGEKQYLADDMVGAEATLSQAAALFKAQGDSGREAAVHLIRLQVVLDGSHVAEMPVGLLQTLSALTPVIEHDPIARVKWLWLRGAHAAEYGSAVEADTWLKQAVELADGGGSAQAAVAFYAHLELATLRARKRDMAGALQHLQKAREITNGGSALPEAARTWQLTLAQINLELARDNIASALQLLSPAVAWCDSALGPQSRRCANLKYRLVHFLTLAGDTKAAQPWMAELLPWLRQPISLRAKVRGALTLAQALAMDGQTDEQMEPILLLMDLVRPTPAVPLQPQQHMPILVTLAEIRLRAGDHAGSQQWLERAEASLLLSGAEQGTASKHIRLGRALALQSLGQDQAALTTIEELCKEVDLRGSVVLKQLNCVHSLAATGRTSEALALLQSALPVLTKSLGSDAPHTRRVRQLLESLRAPGGYTPPPWHPSQIFYAF